MQTKLPTCKDNDGFSLIELLVVVLIIGVLASIAIPSFVEQRNQAWQTELREAVRNTALQIESQSSLQHGKYPYEVLYSTDGIDRVDPVPGHEKELSLKIVKNRLFKADQVTMYYERVANVYFKLCGEHTMLKNSEDDTYLGVLMYDTTSGGLKPWNSTIHSCNSGNFQLIE